MFTLLFLSTSGPATALMKSHLTNEGTSRQHYRDARRRGKDSQRDTTKARTRWQKSPMKDGGGRKILSGIWVT